MARRNNRNTAREVKNERHAVAEASSRTYPSGRETRSAEREMDRHRRNINLPRYALNDLYERSSI